MATLFVTVRESESEEISGSLCFQGLSFDRLPYGHDKDTSRDVMVNVDARNAELTDDSGRTMRLCTEDGVNSGPPKAKPTQLEVGYGVVPMNDINITVEPLVTHTPSVDGPMVCVMEATSSSFLYCLPLYFSLCPIYFH